MLTSGDKATGYERMDIIATFRAPFGGWEALKQESHPSFGLRVHQQLGDTFDSGNAVSIQSQCDRRGGADGCSELQPGWSCASWWIMAFRRHLRVGEEPSADLRHALRSNTTPVRLASHHSPAAKECPRWRPTGKWRLVIVNE